LHGCSLPQVLDQVIATHPQQQNLNNKSAEDDDGNNSNNKLLYAVDDNPPWHLSFLLGFQVIIEWHHSFIRYVADDMM